MAQKAELYVRVSKQCSGEYGFMYVVLRICDGIQCWYVNGTPCEKHFIPAPLRQEFADLVTDSGIRTNRPVL